MAGYVLLRLPYEIKDIFQEWLAERVPDRAAEDEVLSLPDLVWQVEGFGMGRVARTELRGRKIAVRLGVISGQDFWLVDVNDRPGCARFRSRLDAMSKMGVASAIKAYETRAR